MEALIKIHPSWYENIASDFHANDWKVSMLNNHIIEVECETVNQLHNFLNKYHSMNYQVLNIDGNKEAEEELYKKVQELNQFLANNFLNTRRVEVNHLHQEHCIHCKKEVYAAHNEMPVCSPCHDDYINVIMEEDVSIEDCKHNWIHQHTNWYKCNKCELLGTKDTDDLFVHPIG